MVMIIINKSKQPEKPKQQEEKKVVSPVEKPKLQPKKEEKPIVPEPVKKKMGRPTNEELIARRKNQLQTENKLKEEIIAKQQEIFANPILASTSSVALPDYPLFQVGEKVRLIEKVLTHENADRLSGVVSEHKVTSAFVHIVWEDGHSDYRHAKVLEKYVKPGRAKRV